MAEAVALQVSVHRYPQRSAGFSVKGQNRGREASCHGQTAWQAGGEVPLLHLVFRAKKHSKALSWACKCADMPTEFNGMKSTVWST